MIKVKQLDLDIYYDKKMKIVAVWQCDVMKLLSLHNFISLLEQNLFIIYIVEEHISIIFTVLV